MLAEIQRNSAFKLFWIYTHNVIMKDLFKISPESTMTGQKRLKK